MNKFKVGDRVKRKATAAPHNKLSLGGEYRISRADGRFIYLVGITGSWKEQSFQLASPSKSGEWSFHVRHAREISDALLREDLTKDSPVLLLESSVGVCSVHFHKSLLDKSIKLNMDLPPKVTSTQDFKEAIAWAKKVKEAPWGTPSIKITVHKPTI